ncbi:unnamed protein product [Diamesa tonsa]
MTDLINFNQLGIIEPDQRIKQLVNSGSNITVDPNQAVLRYYRSGTEIYKMAKIYLAEGNIENAYILLLRFLTLFVEKIHQHPENKNVPAEQRKANNAKLKEILPITETLKVKLLERYKKEYAQILIEQEQERRKAVEDAKRKEQEDLKNKISGNIIRPGASTFQPSAPDLSDLDKVIYPNDFPSDPQKPSQGLLPGTKPAYDRTIKPSISLVEGGLRTVKVPENTMIKFLELAKSNTARNVETCGILAGQLKQNQLIITHVILPKQSGTSDSCNTMNEEEIFDIQDQMNLITLGWIHTHPSQTAFLSSVDLHTQAAYQIMMPEALAIVCSPKYNTTGFFCLTPSYGLDYISKCRESGFHPHPNNPALFMEACHVSIDSSKIIIVDLRK